MSTVASDDLTRLLRVFHLVERAFSKFFNAAREQPNIDRHLTDWLLQNQQQAISSLVSDETVYMSSPYDLIKFLNARIAETAVSELQARLEKRKEQALATMVNSIIEADKVRAEKSAIGEAGEKAVQIADANKGARSSPAAAGDKSRIRGDIRDGVAKPFSEAWDQLGTELRSGVFAVVTDGFLKVDLDLIQDPGRRKEIESNRSPASGWRHRRNMIEDFQAKLGFVVKARNSTMHGYLPSHATPEIIIETVADVFNSMQHLIGKHVDKVPEGHLFLMGAREIAAYSRGEKLSAPEREINGVKCLLTSFGLRRDTSLDEGQTLSWPTRREAEKVWVTMRPLATDKRSARDDIEAFEKEIRRDKIMQSTPENCRIRVELSRFIPVTNERDEYAPPAWRQNRDGETYACFWFAPIKN